MSTRRRGGGAFQRPPSVLSSSSSMVDVKRLLLPDRFSRSSSFAKSSAEVVSASRGDAAILDDGRGVVFCCNFPVLPTR